MNTPSLSTSEATVIDLFAGAGGTSLGFKRAGFKLLAAVEMNESAAETYEKNLTTQVRKTDIRDLPPQKFREELKLQPGELTVLIGCPPCQGFSEMRNDKGANDERNKLSTTYLEFVNEFRPRFTVFENVPGLKRSKHGQEFYDKLLKGLAELGYRTKEEVVDAVYYGVPQYRKRVLVIGSKGEEPPPFPQQTHSEPGSLEVVNGLKKPWITVRNVLSDYPVLEAGENGERGGKYPNHVAPSIREKTLKFIRQVPKNGGSRKQVAKEDWLQCHSKTSGEGFCDVYGRVRWDKPSNTMTTGCTNLSKGRFVHPEQDRALTPREAATLQGFPVDFIFYGSDHATQIGNAVPPPLAQAVAEAIRNHIIGQEEMRALQDKLQERANDVKTPVYSFG